jgi:excisionase family DNA binding protein
MHGQLYKIRQVAGRLNISEPTLYRMVSRGEIGHLRVGCGRGAIRFSEEQVQAYLLRAGRGATPDPPPAPPVRLKHLRL